MQRIKRQANEELEELARWKRRDPTGPERELWKRLRCRRCGGMKFRRQAVIGGEVVDFWCPGRLLAVEVGGPGEVAEGRIRKAGARLVVVTEEEVIQAIEAVILRIKNAAKF